MKEAAGAERSDCARYFFQHSSIGLLQHFNILEADYAKTYRLKKNRSFRLSCAPLCMLSASSPLPDFVRYRRNQRCRAEKRSAFRLGLVCLVRILDDHHCFAYCDRVRIASAASMMLVP